MKLKAGRQALKAALIYVFAASGWILFSDELLKWLIHDPDVRARVEIFKGLAFVLVTGGLLHLAVRRWLRHWERGAEQRLQTEIARQETVDKLHRSEEQLRLVMEASADSLWDWNLKTGIAQLSPRYWEIIGYRPGEVVADMEFYKRLVYPEDLPAALATLEEHFAGKTAVCTLEYRMVTKAGTVIWIWARGKLVERAADGAPLRMVGTISDITLRKQTEAALRESQERLSKIFQSSPMAMALSTQAEGRYLDVNEEFLKMLQRSRDEVIGHTAFELGVWAHPEQRDAIVARIQAEGAVRNAELEIYTRSRQVRHILWSVEAVVIGGERYLIGSALDVTERNWFERRSECFSQLGLQLSTATTKKAAARIITEAAFNLLGWDAAYLTLCTAEADAVHKLIDLDTLNGQRCEVPPTTEISKPTPNMLRVLAQGAELFFSRNPESDQSHLVPFGDVTRRSRSLMFVPVRINGQSIGVLSVQSYQADAYTQRDLEALQALADHAAGTLVRLESEAALLERDEQLRLYVEHIPSAVAMFDLDMNYLVASQRWKENNRWGDRSFIGRSHYEVVPDIPQRWKEIHRRCLAGAIEKSDADPFPRADGRNEWIRWEVRPWHQADGAIGGIIIFYENITERMQAEAALRENELLMRSIMENTKEIIFVKDRECRFIYMNPAGCRFSGVTPEKLLGHSKADFYPNPAEAAQFMEDDRRVMESSLAETIEEQIAGADGVKHVFLTTKVARRDSQGNVIGLIGVAHDITERKRMEVEMQRTSRWLLNTQRISKVGGWTFNVKTGEAWVSPEAARIYGHTGSGPITISYIQSFPLPQHRPRLDAALRELVAGNQPYDLEFQIVRGTDQAVVDIHSVAEYNATEGTVLGVIEDITERKLAETALRESETKFRAIFNNNALATAIVESDSTISMVNDAYCLVSGYTRQDVIGKSWHHTVMAEDLPRLMEYNRRRMINPHDAPDRYEFRFLHKNGEVRHGQISVALIQGTGQVIASMLDITERKLAEQKLRESEERYRQLFELESDAVVLLDCETRRFVDANQSALRLYGYSREELLQLTVEGVSAEPEKTLAIFGTGDHFVPLRWHRKKNGACFAAEISTNIFSHQGRRTELATIRDITARKQVVDMLEETTGQLLEAQQIAGLGSYNFNVAAGTWTGSKVLDELFGIVDPAFTRDLAGWLKVVHPQDRAEMQRYLQEDVLQGRATFDRIYRIVRQDDRQERWVHGLGKLVLDDHGRVAQMVGVIQDITDRKRAEEQMSVQFSALTAADNAIVITDRAGKIKWVNPAFSKLTGYSAQEAIGHFPRMLKSGEHSPTFYANLWVTILTGNVWRGELVNRRKDGQLYTEEMTVTPVSGADGEIAHFVAIKQDITERRQFEKRLQQAQKMEAIGTLAGGIAHDFNNILAAMFGYAYLLQQDVEGNPTAQENIGEILKATGRAKELVQQILTFSRQREQKPQVIKLDTVVKEAIKFLRASMPAQIKIELNLSADAPAVLADPTQIYQVAVNLATNALHAMEGRPGHLTVSLEPFQPDELLIRSHPELKAIAYTRLTVADTGHGMDAKTLERIFEPFFTTKPVGKGTGLGLAVVHGIVQSHSGVITVNSEVGRGTTFRLYFPGRTQVNTAPAPADSHAANGRGQSILLLDDEPALTSVLQRLLKRLNYQVTASNNAREVVAWCRENPARFDLVITDLTMPDMNGLEVARQIRTIRPDLPVILASGYTAELNRDNLQAAGICALLEKPVSMISLANIVRRTLGVK